MGAVGCTEQKGQLGFVPWTRLSPSPPGGAQHLHSTLQAFTQPGFPLARESHISLLILLISTSPLPSHYDDEDDVLPTQPRGAEPPSAQPLGSPVLGFSSFSLVLEQIKTR